MSVWIIGLLIGLPVSVWLLANICAIIDEPQPLPALVRLSLAVCVILVVLLWTDRAYLYPLLVSGVVVLLLHTAAFFMTTRLAIGVPIYERAPPPTPMLEDSLPDQTEQSFPKEESGEH